MLLLAIPALSTDYPVTHAHLRKGLPGTLTIDAAGIRYTETKQHKKPHAYTWKWNDIQRIVLSPLTIEITTYQDVKWLAGRDLAFTFRGHGLDTAYPLLTPYLPRRVSPELATTGFTPIATFPAKRLEGRSGHQGTLLIGDERIVFQSDAPLGSHTWIVPEIDNISSADPLEFTIASLGIEYRMQLKQPLPEALYNTLWRKLNTTKGH